MKNLLLPLLFITLSATAQKRDSLKFDTNEVKMLYRNQIIFQQYMHKVEISALIRDRLDSVYQQSAVLFENKLKPKVKKGGK